MFSAKRQKFKIAERDGHGKSRNGHGKFMEKYFVKSVGTLYTDHAGLEISVISRIASLFSRQIANVNAGPILALESMGAKRTFRCHVLNIGLMYKQ